MNSKNNLLGVILCGGRSKRMGSDKGLLQKEDKTWVEIVAGKLEGLHIPVVVSINEEQKEAYSKIFTPEQLLVDAMDIKGPLEGLLTVHKTYPDKNILLLACDMIEMDIETLNNLVNEYEQRNEFNFYAYKNNDILEPFCAIYTATALKLFMQKVEKHELSTYSLFQLFHTGQTKVIPLLSSTSFKNYNTPESIS